MRIVGRLRGWHKAPGLSAEPKSGCIKFVDWDTLTRSDKTAPTRSNTAPEPVGAYSQARRIGSLPFLPGMGPRSRGSQEIPGVRLDRHGNVARYDIEMQCHAKFVNVRAVLEGAGSGCDNLVDIAVFLTDIEKDFPTYNRVHA